MMRAPDPPALTGEPIAGADDEDGEFGLSLPCRAPVDFVEQGAQRAHAGAAEAVSDRVQRFGVRQHGPGARARLQQGFDLDDVKH